MQLKVLRGLPPEQLKPRASTVGACLRVGQKDPERGFPIDKHMFFVVEPETRDSTGPGRKFEYRQVDRRFDGFHKLQPSQRSTFYGTFAQHHKEEIWTHGEFCHRGPSERPDVTNPRHRGPWCHGNAVVAERWDGSSYQDIPCPGPACPFQQKTFRRKPTAKQRRAGQQGGLYSPCAPKAKIYFYPRWPSFLGDWAADAERPLMKFASGGQLMRDTFAGLFAEVEKSANGLIEIQSWFGLPFSISLGARTNPQEQHRYPVIRFALDGDPIAWMRWQGQTFQGLLEAPVALALGAVSPNELDSDTVGSDDDLTSAGPAVKPAVVAEPDVVEVESVQGEAQPAVAGPVDPEGAEEPPPAQQGIGDGAATVLETHLRHKRGEADPRAFPGSFAAVAKEAGAPADVRPSEWTEAEAESFRQWVTRRADQMPRASS